MFVAIDFGAEVVVSDLAFVIETVEDVVVFVGRIDAGWPFACCRSLPCSWIRVGPNCESFWRSWGTILERTRFLTGCFEDSSE